MRASRWPCRSASDTKTPRSEHADVLQGRPEADQRGTQEIHEAVTAQVLGGVRDLKPATTAHDEARLEMALAQDRGMINGRRTPARRDRNIQKRSHVLVVLPTIDVETNVRRKDVATCSGGQALYSRAVYHTKNFKKGSR